MSVMRTSNSVEPTHMMSPSLSLSGVRASTSTLSVKEECGGNGEEQSEYMLRVSANVSYVWVTYLFSCVPLVDLASIRKTCPFLNSICKETQCVRGLYYDKVPQRSKSMLTFACVVEISLSLYKLTPCSLKAFPVDLPILNTSSPSWKTITNKSLRRRSH